MNLTCFYCQTPFTLSMDQKIAALRKMHAENLHHYDAHCPRCGRANAISRERLEMFTPGWEEAIKEPAMPASSGAGAAGASDMPTPVMVPSTPPAERREMQSAPAMKKKAAAPARRRHAPASKKKAAKKAPAKKSVAKKATKKKSAAKPKKSTAKRKSSSRKTAKKSKRR